MSQADQPSHSGYLESQMLIAMPAMADPNFARSVTLMCQHTEDGAVGITINRVSSFNLGEILDQLKIPCADPSIRQAMVLEGGPVHRDRGFVLHTPMDSFESSLRINSDIMVTTSRDVLAAIAEHRGPQRYLVALGYAGWGDGQLEQELRQNAWLSVAADSAIVFESPIAERWVRAVGSLGIDIGYLHGSGGHA